MGPWILPTPPDGQQPSFCISGLRPLALTGLGLFFLNLVVRTEGSLKRQCRCRSRRFGGQRAPQPNPIPTVTKSCRFKYRRSFSAWRLNGFVGRFNLCMIAVGVSPLRWIYPCVPVLCIHQHARGHMVQCLPGRH